MQTNDSGLLTYMPPETLLYEIQARTDILIISAPGNAEALDEIDPFIAEDIFE